MKLFFKVDRPFKLLQARNRTVTVDVNETHNGVSIGLITLAKTAKKTMQITEVKRYDDVPSDADNTSVAYVIERIIRHEYVFKETIYLG